MPFMKMKKLSWRDIVSGEITTTVEPTTKADDATSEGTSAQPLESTTVVIASTIASEIDVSTTGIELDSFKP